MAPQVGPLLPRQPIPQVGSENRNTLVGQLLRIFRVEVLRPVDARGGIPLEIFALLVELAQRVAALLVFPLEDGVEAPMHRPFSSIHRNRVPLLCAHWETSG